MRRKPIPFLVWAERWEANSALLDAVGHILTMDECMRACRALRAARRTSDKKMGWIDPVFAAADKARARRKKGKNARQRETISSVAAKAERGRPPRR